MVNDDYTNSVKLFCVTRHEKEFYTFANFIAFVYKRELPQLVAEFNQVLFVK